MQFFIIPLFVSNQGDIWLYLYSINGLKTFALALLLRIFTDGFGTFWLNFSRDLFHWLLVSPPNSALVGETRAEICRVLWICMLFPNSTQKIYLTLYYPEAIKCIIVDSWVWLPVHQSEIRWVAWVVGNWHFGLVADNKTHYLRNCSF